MKKNASRTGMSLVELTIVIVVMGVIMAGVFMLFLSSTEHFNFARRQNELDITGRLILDRVTNETIWAGYMPRGGWDNDEWHPIVKATDDSLSFFADHDGNCVLSLSEYTNVTVVNQRLRITDNDARTQDIGENITGLEFEYLDERGDILPFPIDALSRDMIRHIRVTLELTAVYTDDVYQTVLRTSISPRNLGVNHNIDPTFFAPRPLRGVIALNIAGDSLNPDPSIDEEEMSERLQLWGYTVRELTDDQLYGYDYTNIDALILRHIPNMLTHFDPGAPTFFRDLPVPTITLSAYDAFALYGIEMGGVVSASEIVCDSMTMVEYGPPTVSCPTGIFPVYRPLSNGYQSVLTGMMPFDGDTLYAIPGSTADYSGYSGVYAINLDTDSLRRVHFSAWEAHKYDENNGWELFYNIVKWMAVIEEEYLGTPITLLEDFEGPQATAQNITVWSDDIHTTTGVDTVQVFYESFTGGYVGSYWTMLPLGGGRIDVSGNALRTDRSAAGAYTRNLAILTLDLSAYDEYTDDLRMTYCSYSYEGAPDAMDGSFMRTLPASPVQLANITFPTLGNAPGDMTFYTNNTTYGRYRIHSPSTWNGDGNFVTMDKNTSNSTEVQNRLMFEIPTDGVTAGEQITVAYRFHDHTDESYSGIYGDFLGYSTTGIISGTPTLIANLSPGSYSNNTWTNRTNTFNMPATPVNPIYIIFGQRGTAVATGYSVDDGISLDNILVTAPGDTTYSSIGGTSSTPSWTRSVIDLDAAARLNSIPFATGFQTMLSQYGNATGGRRWDDVEVTAQSTGTVAPGWRHGRLSMSRVDDWRVKTGVYGSFGESWVSQTASTSSYSNNSYCFLQSPAMTIPAWVESPILTFSHRMVCESRNDGGYVQISVDGGAWTNLTKAGSGLNYNNTSSSSFPAGSGIDIFTGGGSSTPRTESANLSAYRGHTVSFRFVFGSNGSITSGSGWLLDNFELSGSATGYQITAIGFNAGVVPSAWNYLLDIYMASGPDSSFASSGEWNKVTMMHVANSQPVTVGDSGWNTIPLTTPFVLTPGANLHVKIEQANTGWMTGNGISWLCSGIAGGYRCRRAESASSDPVSLSLHFNRPDIRLYTPDGMLTVEGGAIEDESVPINSRISYNDCEMIFSPSELGTGGGIGTWTHGGRYDDWEIGEPRHLLVDPGLTSENGSSVAGTDLSGDNGCYNADEYAWFASPAYEMPSDAMYDSVSMKLFKCLRNAPNDDGYIQIAFMNSPDIPPEASTEWKTVRTYTARFEDVWDYEVIRLTSQFEEAWTQGRSYFCIRFIQSSGPFVEFGGWNIDNIQFFAK